MTAIVMSSSSDRDEREIDENHDESNTSDSSSDSGSSCSSSEGNTTDKQYSSGVPRVPLEVLQEEMRTRVAFGSFACPSTNAPLSTSSSEEENLYCCVVGIPFRMDEKKLGSLRSWY